MNAFASFMERFPLLGLLAGTWDVKEPQEESIPPFSTDLQALYVYGIGTGTPYLQAKNWLKGDAKRRLIFLEDDSAQLNGFLRLPQAAEIVRDEQVHFAWLQQESDLDLLAEKFPFLKIDLVALPSKKSRKQNQLKLTLLRKTTLSQSLLLDRQEGSELFAHFLRNGAHLHRSFYANALQGAFKGIPAIICGAGPSLETQALKSLADRALLIAGGSSIAALLSQGIQPHFGLAVDPNPEEGVRFQNVDAPNMPLLYSTRLFPDVVEKHRGPLGYMRSGVGGAPELWLEEELGLKEPLLGAKLSPESISVTTMCVAWAEFLGCDPIVFNGLDLAYTHKKRYAPGVTAEAEHPSQGARDVLLKRKDRNGKWVQTAVRWIMESESLSHFSKQCPSTRFINTTTGGIGFADIPFQPLAEVPLLSSPRDLYAQVQTYIKAAPKLSFPPLNELKESLAKVIDHLKILNGQQPGSKALSEFELREELAASVLFYDAPWGDWKAFLTLALRYDLVFMEFIAKSAHRNP